MSWRTEVLLAVGIVAIVAGGAFHLLRGKPAGHVDVTTPSRVDREPGSVDHPASGTTRLAGRVLDPYGEAIAGAAVELFAVTDEGERVSLDWPVETVRRGNFSLRSTSPGIYLVRISAPNRFVAREVPVSTPGRVEVTLQHGIPYAGSILLSGRAVAGAEVRFRTDVPGEPAAVTGENGGFSFLVPPVPGVLVVTHAGARHRFPLDPRDSAPGVFSISDGVVVSGAVVGLDGGPVDGAVVTVEILQRVRATTTTGPDGTFRIGDLPAGRPDLSVHAPGFLPGRPDRPRGAPPARLAAGGHREYRLRLLSGTVVTGRLVGEADGEPIPGGRVRIAQGDGIVPGEWTSDGAGRFTLEARAGEPLDLMVLGSAHVRTATDPHRASSDVPAEALALGDVPVPASSTWNGDVREEGSGSTVSSGVVLGRRDPWPAVGGGVGEAGRFVLPGMPATAKATLEFRTPERPPVVVEAEMGEDGARILVPPAGRIDGRALVQGASAQQAVVIAYRPYPRIVAAVVADDVGRFAVTDIDAGAYTVRVHHPAGEPLVLPRVVTDGALLKVELQPGREIRGQIRRADGRPVAAAEIRAAPILRLHDDPAGWIPGQLLGKGTFIVRGVGDGPMRIEARTADGLVATAREELSRVPPLLRLDAPVVVAGTVTGPDGRIAAGRTVRLLTSPPREVVTDEEGEFRFADLSSDVVVLVVPAANGAAEARLAIQAGVEEVEVRLEPGCELIGTVERAGAGPCLAGTVELRRAGVPGTHLVLAVRDGAFRAKGLPAGRFVMIVRASGCRAAERDVELPGGPVTVILDAE
jgi:hypothetical protein